MSIQDTKKVALEFLSAIKDRDSARIDAVLADDGAFWVIGDFPFSGTNTKKQFLGTIVNVLFGIIEGPPTINVEDITAEDDRVSVIGTGQMVTKTGTPYCNNYHFLMVVRNGKIVRYREYFDTQLVARAFGV